MYNAQSENIGEIEDIVIGDGKAIIGPVASVGGFLAIDKSYVVLAPPPSPSTMITAASVRASGTPRLSATTDQPSSRSQTAERDDKGG